jgi:hypothetical protein
MEEKDRANHDRSEHKPVDPGRNAAREQRTPGKPYEPKRSEPDPSGHRKAPGRGEDGK